MTVEERVHDLLADVVATLDVELLDVEFTGCTLRLVVDRPLAPGGAPTADPDRVTTEQLAEVNRLVSPLLDQDDPVPGRYTLEVSSPGLERRLARPVHFERAIGETVVVKLVPPVEPRRYKGRLAAASDDTVTIETTEIDGVDLADPVEHTLALADVDSARTVFDWGPTPKPGGPRPGGKKRAKKNRSPQSPPAATNSAAVRSAENEVSE